MEEKIYQLLDSVRKSAERVRRSAASAGKTASNAAYAVGKQAESALDTAKLNVEILKKKNAVRDAMRELGEMLYATHIGQPSDTDTLLGKLQSIDAMKAEIAQLEIAAGKAERVRVCHICGAEARAEDRFCRSCGEKL